MIPNKTCFRAQIQVGHGLQNIYSHKTFQFSLLAKESDTVFRSIC